MSYWTQIRSAFKYGKGVRHFAKGQYRDAIPLLEAAIQLDKNNEEPLCLSMLGRSHLAIGHYRDALRVLSKALELFSANQRVLTAYQQAELMATQHALQEALRACEKMTGRGADLEE